MANGTEQRDQLIGPEKVAELYDINRTTVWHWVKQNRIPKPVVSQNRFTRWSANTIHEHIESIKRGEMAEATS